MGRADPPRPASGPLDPDGVPRLRWPCIVNLPAVAEETGGLGGRFRASWEVTRGVWRTRPSLLRSLLGWTGVGWILMGVATFYLGAGARPERALVALGIQAAWAVLWIAIAALHLGTVRGEDGIRKNGVGIPNGLTLLRILLVPTTCWAILAHPRLLGHGGLVASLIFVVGFTDVVDGFLARLLRFQTVFGRYFDHVADVLICSALALAEHWAGLMPLWLTSLYLLRYLGAWAAGTFGLATRPNLRITPSFMGRLGTLVAGSTLFLTIAQPLLAPGFAAEVAYLHIGTAAVIALNIVVLGWMAIRGTAFERTDTPPGSPDAGADQGPAGALAGPGENGTPRKET